MVFYEEKRDLNQSAGSGVGNACERAEGDEASRGGRSGRKNRGKARMRPRIFSGTARGVAKQLQIPPSAPRQKAVVQQGGCFWFFTMISVPGGTGDISPI